MHFNESQLRNKEKAKCRFCGTGNMIPKDMWLFELPKVFSIAIHWADSDNVTREELLAIFSVIRPVLDIGEFLTISNADKKTPNKSKYVLRGFIAYYGKHYVSYFYSEIHDEWVQLDDETIKQVGDFQ